MTLARLVLASGRDIALSALHLRSTYDGLLEGYPNPRINDRTLAALPNGAARVLPGAPVHVVEPARTRPPEAGGRAPFGPLELLPAVVCLGWFRSHPVDAGLDPVLHESRLVIAWFQDEAGLPVTGPATEALRAVRWEDWAEDAEL